METRHLHWHILYYCSILQVTEESEKVIVRFKSKIFASSFGAGLLIAPNTIDFGSVFDNFGEKLLENIHVFIVLCLLILSFMALVPYARYQDRRDTLRVSMSINTIVSYFWTIWK